MSKHHITKNLRDLLWLAVVLLGSPAIPASAQNRPEPRTVPERQFTVPPDVPTAVVLQTEPDASCDLHAAGVNDPSHTMRFYANMEGYVRFHFTPDQDIQDAHLQLDCTAAQGLTTHPVHLRIAVSPTEDMPAPEASVPAPKGSKLRPALTEEAARQLSDEDIIAQGYPPRPNATEAPEAYAEWLGRVSRPVTVLPPHSVSRSDISHSPRSLTAGPNTSLNWSGFVAQGPPENYSLVPGFYRLVRGSWHVPSASADVAVSPLTGFGPSCYSAVWVGLDGNTTKDLVQAGTEQDATFIPRMGTVHNYYAWTEAINSNQPMQEVFSVSPGNAIAVAVWVGDSKGNVNPTGAYAWFDIIDAGSGKEFKAPTALGKNFGFSGNSAEWIVERPCVSTGPTSPCYYPELAQYSSFEMTGAEVLEASGTVIPYTKAENQQTTMRETYTPQPDNNVLSTVTTATGSPNSMWFSWKNFY